MATEIRWRRGTTAQHSTFTGAPQEVTVDTDLNALVVHDGVTAGGFPITPTIGLQNQIDDLNNNKADASDVYTITQSDNLLDDKLDKDASNVGDATAQAIFRSAIGAVGNLHKVTVVSSSGTHNFDPESKYAKVMVIGAGAAGGSVFAGSGTAAMCASGGGAGGMAWKFIDLSGIGSATLVIGAGGTAVAGADGNSGESSSYDDGTNAFHATGGQGGIVTNETGNARVANGGAGGTGIGGDINTRGGAGGNAYSAGGNASGAGSLALSLSGSGGDGYYGGGGVARSIQDTISSSAVGIAGFSFGAGGSGSARILSGSAQLGGAGADGAIIIEEFK